MNQELLTKLLMFRDTETPEARASLFWDIAEEMWGDGLQRGEETTKIIDACSTLKPTRLRDYPSTRGRVALTAWGVVNWLCAPFDTLVLFPQSSVTYSVRPAWDRLLHLMTPIPNEIWSANHGRMSFVTKDPSSGTPITRSGFRVLSVSEQTKKIVAQKLMGLKSRRVFLIIEDGASMPNGFLESLLPNLSTNPTFQTVMCGR